MAFPKGRLTVVSGLSGSGKSSLVHDVLEAEARRRFLETLSLYERQGVHEGAEADVDAISGLGVAISVAPERLVYSPPRHGRLRFRDRTAPGGALRRAGRAPLPGMRRSDAAHPRRVALPAVWRSSRHRPPAPLPFLHLRRGLPEVQRRRLAAEFAARQADHPPEKPLTAGAWYSPGFFPQGFLGKPYNSGYYLLQALAQHYGFDPATTPWNEMSTEAQQAFLFGSQELLDVTTESRTGRINRYRSPFPGFYGFIRDWDVGGTYTDNVPCPECQAAPACGRSTWRSRCSATTSTSSAR